MKYNKNNLKKAKELRKNMTKEEVKLWNILRAGKFYGLKFKRQVLIGNHIVDFLCKEKKLIIEVDGGQHNENDNIIHDEIRSQYLQSEGYKVIRFWNNEVWNNLEGVIEIIKKNVNC